MYNKKVTLAGRQDFDRMKNEENKKYIKLAITAVAVIMICLLFFFLLFRMEEIKAKIRMVMGILSPFVYGAVIAYILTPACNRIEKPLRKVFRQERGKNALFSGLSITLALLLALALLWVLVILVFPQVWSSLVGIVNVIPDQIDSANTRLHNLLETRPELQSYWDSFSATASAKVESWLNENDLLSTAGSLLNNFGTQVLGVFSSVKNLLLGILISVYFLASRKQFAAQGKMVLRGVFAPRWADLIEEELHYADRMFNGFLLGKLEDSAIIGVLCFIGTSIMGFKSAALISVVVGVTNIIPFFGPFIGAVPCAILLLLEKPIYCVYFLIFILVLQQLDGNVIGPKILGNSTGLSSFWVLFSILLFGGLWGIAGMIIGVPLFAVIYDVIRRLTFYGLRRHRRAELIESYESAFHPEPKEKKKSRKNLAFLKKKK